MAEAIRRGRLRLEHAETHLHELSAAISSFIESAPLEVRIDANPRQGQDVILKPLQDVPDGLSFIVGDCIHDIRAVLDNLVSDLGVMCFGYASKTELSFPVAPNPAAFERRSKELHRFPAWALSEFRAVQPYDDRGRLNPSHAVWVMEKLWNMDKHRSPPLANVVLGDTTILYAGQSFPVDSSAVGREITTADGEIVLLTLSHIQGIDEGTGMPVIIESPAIQAHVSFGLRFGPADPPLPATGLDVWRVVERAHWIVAKMLQRVEDGLERAASA